MDEFVEPRRAEIAYETDEPVRYETEGQIAWITLNRPRYNNAQNSQMAQWNARSATEVVAETETRAGSRARLAHLGFEGRNKG